MSQRWKTIKGWSNFLVSDDGVVKSIDRYEDFRGGKRFRPGRIIKTRVLRKYECVSIKQNKLSKTFFMHRLVAEMFIKRGYGKNIVNHKDGNRLNNHASNLEWCTQKENIKHAMTMNNWTRGEKHGCAVLTEDDVRFIRSTSIGGFILAKLMGVSYTNIKRIRAYKIWKNVC